MTNRQRIKNILEYRQYDRLPILHFGFWPETLQKWAKEGHITHDEATNWRDGNSFDKTITEKLGFDCNYHRVFRTDIGLLPPFERRVIEERPDGSRLVVNEVGVVFLEKDDAGSIPAEIDHLLKSRKEWEEFFLPRLQYTAERSVVDPVIKEYIEDSDRDEWYGLHCGSLFGSIRNMLGVEGSSYLYADDEELFKEIIDTVGDLCYQCTKSVLETTSAFDFGHFWEDICFKNGPLVIPSVFDKYVGPHYMRIVDLLSSYGINIVSLDCDGLIDSLIPTWINNGVNTMFPIEVGTWNADIRKWREKYGRKLRGVGGMRKYVFAQDFAAVDAEVERLKPLVELGGYIPCPDHRISPDAKWENVCYYAEKLRKVFN